MMQVAIGHHAAAFLANNAFMPNSDSVFPRCVAMPSSPHASCRTVPTLTGRKAEGHKARDGFLRLMTAPMRVTWFRYGPLSVALLCAFFLIASFIDAGPAKADLRLCNKTPSRVGVSIGYKDKKIWTTEGWWNVPVNGCETLVSGTLVSRYYYVYAVDYDHGGEWSGKYVMCTKDKMFTIEGTEDCVARGYNRSGFFEVDTGEQQSWTIQLNEPAQQGAKTQ